ncbi:MAG TPA: monovalent cation/H(+) antiporter subunit G [Edaphocola sp.]|nr:monovalent cation/H(+) antiporter subunit G [Edaphocola sp.]
MTNIIFIILCIVGTLATVFSALGILRMPDFYSRLSVTVKASTLGTGLLLICAAMYFAVPDVTNRAIAIVLFLILTSPVAGHMIARAAYMSKTKMWEGSKLDEMEGMYDEESHLASEKKEKITPDDMGAEAK